MRLPCQLATAELFPHATRGNPAVNRVTQKPHFLAHGGGSTATHSAESQGDSSCTIRQCCCIEAQPAVSDQHNLERSGTQQNVADMNSAFDAFLQSTGSA